jgi:hypothetical protein
MPVPELHCAVGGVAPSSTVRPDGLWASRTPSWLVVNPADPWMDFLLAKQQCPGPGLLGRLSRGRRADHYLDQARRGDRLKKYMPMNRSGDTRGQPEM